MQILTAFNKFTNITITLFDSEMNCLSNAGELQPYCLAIADDPERLSKCNCCNKENAQIALSRHCTYIYTCHAGIVEVVSPIFINDSIIAYLMLGKFRDTEREYSSESLISKTAEQYGLDEEKMLQTYHALPELDREAINSAVLLLEMCIQYIASEKYIKFADRLSDKIEQYIDENLKNKITIATLCKQFYLNRRSLYSIFKEDFHETVQSYITKKRIEKAKLLLATTDLNINKIVYEIGFADYNYFFKYFKKYTGITPHQYRKQAKSEVDK